jgi:hypothetical protein
VTAIPAELFLVVLFFDLRRLHGLRKGQRQRVAVIGRGLAALLMSALLSGTTYCVATLNRPHPYPSPVSGD